MLRIDRLVCKRDDKPLFEPLSLTAVAGDCVEVLGPNGAGKTTLLRTLAGLHTQFDGEFECADALYQGHRTGLDELLSPLENLQWFGAMRGAVPTDEQLSEVLERVDMTGQAMIPCQRLSQGQQRRVCMARWLLQSTRVWLLDEPYTALDKHGQALLNDVLAQFCAMGGLVLAATHTPLTITTRIALEVEPVARQAI